MLATLIPLAIAAALSTFVGGYFALRNLDRSHLILGFSAGAVIGVAFFDLLPESIALGGASVTAIIAVAFLLYMIIDRMVGIHTHHLDHDHGHTHEEKGNRGVLRAVILCIHSLLDGVAIGLAFQVSMALGAVITVAVLAHDFSDGINTVSSIIKSGQKPGRAVRWLVIDAFAPVVGIFSTVFFTVSDHTLGPILAVFCGFFLYIGASDLVPESYHAHPTKWTTFATVLGAGLIYIVIRLLA